jgi:hypothetical protein
MTNPFVYESSLGRQAAAADLWMELTGRKQAAALDIAQEKIAGYTPPGQPARPLGEVVKRSILPFYARRKDREESAARAAQPPKSTGLPRIYSMGMEEVYRKALDAAEKDMSIQNPWDHAYGEALKHPDARAFEKEHGIKLTRLGGGSSEGEFKYDHVKAAAASPREDAPPRLRNYAGTGAALGAAGGAGLGAGVASKVKGANRAMAALGHGTYGTAIGGAAGLGVGIHKLRKHYQSKQADALTTTQRRLLGGAAGAATAGGAGFLQHYLGARPGKTGKSKHEMAQEMALADLRSRLAIQGFDPENPPASKKLKERYHQMLLDHTRDAKGSPGRAALVGAVPYAVGGAALGAHFAPRFA